MKDKFLEWSGRVAEALNAAPGFTSREVIPPQNDDLKEWVFVNRFDSIEHLRAWRDGEARKFIFAEGRSLVEGDFTKLVGDAAAQFHVENSVTEVILEQVAPGKEAAYQKWSNRIQRAQAETPGYQGGYSQPPKIPGGGWMTLMRFACIDDLDNWMSSPIRSALIAEGKDLIAASYLHRVDASFPGWVPTDASGKAPPNWKASMLVLVGLYPIVCLEILFLGKVLGPMHLNTAVGDFIGNAISVFLTGFGTMPLLCYLLNWWLLPAGDAPKNVHFKGTLIVLMVYATRSFGSSCEALKFQFSTNPHNHIYKHMSNIDIESHEYKKQFMHEATRLAIDSVEKGWGGPFGAVIVKDGKVIGRGQNRVLLTGIPVYHAEVTAIIDASLRLNSKALLGSDSYDGVLEMIPRPEGSPDPVPERAKMLKGCELYVNGAPCPMCMSAIYWARIDKVYFGTRLSDTSKIGFDDEFQYIDFRLPWEDRKAIKCYPDFERDDALKACEAWQNKKDRHPY